MLLYIGYIGSRRYVCRHGTGREGSKGEQRFFAEKGTNAYTLSLPKRTDVGTCFTRLAQLFAKLLTYIRAYVHTHKHPVVVRNGQIRTVFTCRYLQLHEALADAGRGLVAGG